VLIRGESLRSNLSSYFSPWRFKKVRLNVNPSQPNLFIIEIPLIDAPLFLCMDEFAQGR
jgi:hypothetical protein